jgi:hypothetical protein
MCDLHRQFILCSCALSKVEQRDPQVWTWTLSQFQGELEFSMEGILAFPSTQIANAFTAEWVESQLNERPCFDFDYVPAEQDALHINKGFDRSYEPTFMVFVFQNGRWQCDFGHGHDQIRKLIRSGKVEFAEKNRLNTLRSYIFQELKKVERRYSAAWYYLTVTMLELEAYDIAALESEPDLELLLQMMLQTAYDSFGENPPPDEAFLKRFNLGFQRAGKSPKVLPTVPMRRPLDAKEWYDIWESFQNKLGPNDGAFVFDEESIDQWMTEIAKADVKLYQLDRYNHQRSYLLSSHWLPEMLLGDDSFWTDMEFTWSLFCDSNGYYYTKGNFG